MRVIDSQVTSFAPHPMTTGMGYRFERLPSQQANAATQNQLEAMAAQALSKVGLEPNEVAPKLSVQLTAQQRIERNPNAALNLNMGWMWGDEGRMWADRPMLMGLDAQPSYWREVSLVFRATDTQAVVFESRASHQSLWSDGANIWPAMFDAALQGYPNPPSGPRMVHIEIPR